ncbi:MAG: hypothetical protein AAGB26_04505 [Planctomycetota bacterium]
MAYDRADWHLEEDFPKGLPEESAATHIGMFLAWVIHHRLESEFMCEEFREDVEAVRDKVMTGAQFLIRNCGGALTDQDLSKAGNQFAQAYYATDQYLEDYQSILDDDQHESIFHITDSWENYAKIAEVIDKRFATWQGD